MKKLKKSVKILLSLIMMTGLIGSVQYGRHDLLRIPDAAVCTVAVQEESGTSHPPNLSRQDIDRIITVKSRKHGVDSRLVKAIVWAESNYNTNAVSSAGAMGLMQLMPATAKGLGVKNPFCPRENVEGGIKHMKWLLQRYNYNIELAVAAYNAGHRRVTDSVPDIPETVRYVSKVMTVYRGGNG